MLLQFKKVLMRAAFIIQNTIQSAHNPSIKIESPEYWIYWDLEIPKFQEIFTMSLWSSTRLGTFPVQPFR